MVDRLLFVTKEFTNDLPEFRHKATHHMVDLGAGTGKYSAAAVAAFARRGITEPNIVSVEPSASMREAFAAARPAPAAAAADTADTVPGGADTVAHTVVEGSAHAIPLEDESAHCVIAAHSFHWFCDVNALFELTRVLRPKGFLGIAWHSLDSETAWVQKVQRLVKPHWQAAPLLNPSSVNANGRLLWKEVFDTFLGSYYGPLHHHRCRNDVLLTREEVLARVLSTAVLADLGPSGREELALKVDAVLDGPLCAQHRAAAGEDGALRFRVPQFTDSYWCMKLW
jgi:SAM-dependent methyltransferase